MTCNLRHFRQRLVRLQPVRLWLLTTLREKLIKIGAKAKRHAKHVTVQLADVDVTRNLVPAALDCLAELAIPRR